MRFVPVKIKGIPSSESVDSARKHSYAGAVVQSWSLVGAVVGGVCRGVTVKKNGESEPREMRVEVTGEKVLGS